MASGFWKSLAAVLGVLTLTTTCPGGWSGECDDEALAAAARQFFDALDGYRPGDLVVASQVEDMQAYLRRTCGPCSLTTPRVRRSVLSDRSRLSRLFYADGGKSILAAASAPLGGYALIDKLCSRASGRALIERAIAEQDVGLIVQRARQDAIPARSVGRRPSATAGNHRPESPHSQPRRTVYTLDQLLKRFLRLEGAADFAVGSSVPTSQTEPGDEVPLVGAVDRRGAAASAGNVDESADRELKQAKSDE